MFWLYFVRDFYGCATRSATPARHAQQNHQVSLSTFAFNAYKFTLEPKAVVLSTADNVAPVAVGSHLQRLSIEADQAFGVWDAEVGFSLFSANFERITGLLSGECAGHDWIHAVHHDQQYTLNEALLQAVQGVNGRCLVQVADGDAQWRWMLVDVKAPTQQQPHIMVLWRDLSEQKALEETLKQVESSLAMSERGRSAFLSSMSHELRTPLNAIMGFSEMMKSGVFGDLSNPTYQQYSQHIHDSGATLLQKVNDLLDIASMDVGGLQLDEDICEVQELLEEAIAIHSHAAFTRGQVIRVDCAASLQVRADRAKLICSLSHLIANALRHSDDNGEITLTARANSEDGLILSVRDSGEGIAPVQLQLIRDALASDVAYFNISSGGIGLGLSLSKELAARHDGRVMIDSMRYRGSVVSLILPSERVVSGMVQKRRARHLSVVAE